MPNPPREGRSAPAPSHAPGETPSGYRHCRRCSNLKKLNGRYFKKGQTAKGFEFRHVCIKCMKKENSRQHEALRLSKATKRQEKRQQYVRDHWYLDTRKTATKCSACRQRIPAHTPCGYNFHLRSYLCLDCAEKADVKLLISKKVQATV